MTLIAMVTRSGAHQVLLEHRLFPSQGLSHIPDALLCQLPQGAAAAYMEWKERQREGLRKS